MDSPNVDDESLQAVKSLRSKFEQLAVDTSNHLRRSSAASSTTTIGSGPSSPRPRQLSIGQSDLVLSQAHIRASSSSSDLRVSNKRPPPPPPPPPPPRTVKPLASPQRSRPSSPADSVQLRINNESSEGEQVQQGVSALKSKFDSPSKNCASLSRARAGTPTMESPKPILPPRPPRNGETNLLSISPNGAEGSSPASSRPVTPLQHYRPPPPPPISRSKSPLPQAELDSSTAAPRSRLTSPLPPSSPISRQNTSKSSPKPVVPPRPPKPADSPQLLFSSGSLVKSPDSLSPRPEDTKNTQVSPIPPSIPIRRSPPEATPAVTILVDANQLGPEVETGQLAPPNKRSFRTSMPPPPPRHRSSISPNSITSDLTISSPKLLSPPPPLPTRRGTGNVPHAEELPSVSPRLPDRAAPSMTLSERKLVGSNKLPPPPARTIAPGDKLPPPRRPQSPESEDDSGEEDDPKAQAVDSMPDTSACSRRPPILSFREGWAEPKIHVHPHSGTYVASGSNVVVSYGTQIKIYDLAVADFPLLTLDTRDIGAKDAKVTTMEFRPTAIKADRGALLWVGTKEGHLFEIDIRTGYVIASKHIAHPQSVTHIFRYGRSMITLDEGGKTLIFSPGENGEDISLMNTQPRVVRTTEKQEFAKLIDGKLWTATRTEHHSHGYQRIPIIRVYDIFNPAVATGRSLLPTEHVGSITSATIIPAQEDFVYVGHEEGYVSIWSLRTDDGFPKCIEVTRVATSDVLCLEGVNDKLWAGARNGMISVFDVVQKPWVVTNSWNAHPGLPVLKLGVNYNAIERNGKLCVISIGRDECLKLWDGLLGVAWIDNELRESEQEFSSFHDLTMLLVSWNCDSARPDSLTSSSDPVNFEFLNEALTSVDCPDIIAFGFQEVIDLESRKMTAKNVLLGGGGGGGGGGGKKRVEDNGLSDKVTGAYKRWYDRLTAAVRTSMPSSCPYVHTHTENLVGLFTCIFVKGSERARLDDVAVTTVKRGMGGRYGNKGAIVARFVVGDSSFCIINCHLAAGQNAVRRRNADAAGILEEKAVFSAGEHSLAYVGGGDGSMVLDHELVFLHGDLNYRIDHRRDAIIAAVRANDLTSLYQYDQLLREVKYNRGCRLRGFSEGPLTFSPTYKYDLRSDEYDTSEKHRAPAWCDRILWRSREISRVRLKEYRRYEVNVSDHRPVSASFDLTVKTVDVGRREKRKREVEKVWVGVEERLLNSAREFYVSQMLL